MPDDERQDLYQFIRSADGIIRAEKNGENHPGPLYVRSEEMDDRARNNTSENMKIAIEDEMGTHAYCEFKSGEKRDRELERARRRRVLEIWNELRHKVSEDGRVTSKAAAAATKANRIIREELPDPQTTSLARQLQGMPPEPEGYREAAHDLTTRQYNHAARSTHRA